MIINVTTFANPNFAPGTGMTLIADSMMFNTIAIAKKLASSVNFLILSMFYTVKSGSFSSYVLSNSIRIRLGKQISGLPVEVPSKLQILLGLDS